MKTETQTNIQNINQGISNILNKGEDITKALNQANEELSKLQTDTDGLKDKKTKLLNILLKHSKKKSLFKFKDDDKKSSRYNREFEIGVNCSGLGISGSYDNNLRNINDYYARENFVTLCKNPKFLKELLSHIKDENKEIVEKCLTSYGFNSFEEIKEIAKNLFIHVGRKISCSKTEDTGYKSDDIDLLSNEENLKDYDNKNENLIPFKNITDKIFSVSYIELIDFQILINNKDEIISFVTEKMKTIKSEYKQLNSKVEQINKYLKPYEALEQI